MSELGMYKDGTSEFELYKEWMEQLKHNGALEILIPVEPPSYWDQKFERRSELEIGKIRIFLIAGMFAGHPMREKLTIKINCGCPTEFNDELQCQFTDYPDIDKDLRAIQVKWLHKAFTKAEDHIQQPIFRRGRMQCQKITECKS